MATVRVRRRRRKKPPDRRLKILKLEEMAEAAILELAVRADVLMELWASEKKRQEHLDGRQFKACAERLLEEMDMLRAFCARARRFRGVTDGGWDAGKLPTTVPCKQPGIPANTGVEKYHKISSIGIGIKSEERLLTYKKGCAVKQARVLDADSFVPERKPPPDPDPPPEPDDKTQKTKRPRVLSDDIVRLCTNTAFYRIVWDRDPKAVKLVGLRGQELWASVLDRGEQAAAAAA